MLSTPKEITNLIDPRVTLGKNVTRRQFVTISPILLVCLFLSSGCGSKQPQPPSENIVATYNGKSLGKEDLRNYIRKQQVKENEHAFCEKHGFDHGLCDKLEPCEKHPLHSIEAYRAIIKNLALDQTVQDWAKEKGITRRQDVKHGLKHIVDEANLLSLSAKFHQDKLTADDTEIRQYYEEHKDEYKDKPLKEAEAEIKDALINKKASEFIPKYIDELKQNAAVNTNYELLKVEEPTEVELQSYYDNHKDEYVEPEKIKISQIKIDIGESGSEEAARKKAEEVMVKIRAGEDFLGVANKYSDGICAKCGDKAMPVYIGKEGISKDFESNVSNLETNEISSIFKDGNSFYIVKVMERQDKKQKQLGEVMGEVKANVMQEKENKKYELNKLEAIFSVHGKRFTLGEFKEEFSELSLEEQKQFTGFEAKKNLVEQLIIKELLLEDVGDKMLDKENTQAVEEIKSEVIRQILHKEEVDEKIEIPDEQIKKVYQMKKALFIEPAKAKISFIRIDFGASEDEKKKARGKIEEAFQKIKSSIDFSSVAKEYSEDWTASKGGEVEQWIYEGASRLGEMIEHEFHDIIFKLKQGETSEIFEFADNFFIVKMRKKEEKRQLSLEEAKPHIKELLSIDKHHERTARLQDEFLKKSNLVIYDKTLKQMLKEEKQDKSR